MRAPLALAVALAGCTGSSAAERAAPPPPAPPPTVAAVPLPSASAAPEPPPRPRTERAVRRGLWIWEFEKNGPSAERAAALADQWGVARVFVKSGNGNARGRWGRNFRRENLAPFQRRGIEVWAFAYFYGDDRPDERGTKWGTLDDQVAAVGDSTDQPGVAGLIVDAEHEFKKRPEDAKKLCALLRKRLPSMKIGYTSYGWVDRHKKFPFREFDQGCGDVFLPQVYFSEGWPGGPDESLDRLRAGAKKLGLKAPMWPIQSNEPNPDVGVMQRFFDLAGPDASVWYLSREDDTTPEKKRGPPVAAGERVKRLGQLRFDR